MDESAEGIEDNGPFVNAGAWNLALQCCWLGWDVLDQETLRLRLPALNCCDMAGAILTAQALLSSVRAIICAVNDEPDTVYAKTETGWQALCARGELLSMRPEKRRGP